MDDAAPQVSRGPSSAPRVPRRALDAAGVAAILGLTAFSTFHGATTDRWAYDLPISEFLQQVDVGPFSGALFWVGARGVAGVTMAGAAIWLWLSGRRAAAALIALMLVPDALNFVLRELIDRPRPGAELVRVGGGPQGASYPSGTAMHAMLFYGFMVYLLPKVAPPGQWRRAMTAALVFWVLLQGAWLINHGRHWASDVVGGYLYGALYLAVWTKLYPLVAAWDAAHPPVPSRLGFRLRRALAKIGRTAGPEEG